MQVRRGISTLLYSILHLFPLFSCNTRSGDSECARGREMPLDYDNMPFARETYRQRERKLRMPLDRAIRDARELTAACICIWSHGESIGVDACASSLIFQPQPLQRATGISSHKWTWQCATRQKAYSFGESPRIRNWISCQGMRIGNSSLTRSSFQCAQQKYIEMNKVNCWQKK